ncbi:MAG: response regulator transcription factor [Sphingobium sp.]
MAGEENAASALRRPDLLLVEDDAGVRRSLQLLFCARGFNVRSYAAGPALLADPLARRAGCFVADYSMEALDGVEVLGRLRSLGWAGPAVLITGYPSAALTRRALAEGFSEIVEKPFREAMLCDTVARLVGAGQARPLSSS